MQKVCTLKLLPSEAANDNIIKEYIAKTLAKPLSEINGYEVQKKSMDARSKQVWIQLTVRACVNEPFEKTPISLVHFKNVSTARHRVVIIGAGPCGLFAALQLIEKGIQPVILERGKDVRSRRRDLAVLNKAGIVNPESNYCFGEGGAGTYSDGKLYTRSKKRGDINRILHLLVQFGADPNILVEAHPHIGTNKLPAIISAIRELITSSGGEFHFEKKVVDFVIDDQKVVAVKTNDGNNWRGAAFILATGHSARDIFELLHQKKILIEPKPFALGVRIEHPQDIIDRAQYHCFIRDKFLPPASYSLVQQVQGRGVFSFCMCPGGIIAPAATNAGEIVVNGWSPSKRNNPFANSGMVVNVELTDLKVWQKKGPLAALYFQQQVEQQAFTLGGGKLIAPAQRMVDFVNNKISVSLPDCSYFPGIHSTDLAEVLPAFIHKSLQEGLVAFGKKMRGYFTNEAVVVATESRTSSPVRIPRDPHSLQHPQIDNLYPAGEGAGYAGGIVSAAMDGERVATIIIKVLSYAN
jgi:uncharacterized protein